MPVVNFKFLLVSLIILLFAIPMLSQHTDHPDTLEIVFGASLIFGALSLVAHTKEFLAGLIVALFSYCTRINGLAMVVTLIKCTHLLL